MTKRLKALLIVWQGFRVNLIAILLYLFYLLILPNFVALFVKCLDKFDSIAHEFDSCNVSLATDIYLGLALVGMAVVVLGLFFWQGKVNGRGLVITTLVMAISAIIAYYAYIPIVQRSIHNSQVYLDSL